MWWEWFAKLEPSKELKENNHFRFDSVDITRAALVHFFDHAMKEVLEWCNANGTVPTSCGQFDNCASDLIEEGFTKTKFFFQKTFISKNLKPLLQVDNRP